MVEKMETLTEIAEKHEVETDKMLSEVTRRVYDTNDLKFIDRYRAEVENLYELADSGNLREKLLGTEEKTNEEPIEYPSAVRFVMKSAGMRYSQVNYNKMAQRINTRIKRRDLSQESDGSVYLSEIEDLIKTDEKLTKKRKSRS
jgi:hypothetical protein